MIPHSHPHGHSRNKAKHGHPTEPWRGLHKDWRTWVVIGLMLAAIGAYVFTLDDSIQPGSAALNTGPIGVVPAIPSK
jgi:hypothetical protein